MSTFKLSLVTILFTFIYLLLGYYYSKLSGGSGSIINFLPITAATGLWLMQTILTNGMFQQKNRSLFTYGMVIGLALVVSLYLNDPITIKFNGGS